MAVISTGSIFRDSWNNLYTVISEKVPTASGLYSAFPDPNQSNFPDYPIVIIRSAGLETTERSFGRVNRELTLNFLVECFSQSAAQIDELSDQIESALTKASTVNGLNDSGLNSIVFSTAGEDHPIINNRKIHSKALNFNCVWR